jgi:flagellar protein FlgJ
MSSTISGFVAPPQKPLPANIDQLRAQARELESVFVNTLMKQMFSGIKTDQDSFGGGFGEETWRGMQSEQLATQITEAGGFGIADSLLGDLIAMQEAAQNSPSAFYKGTSQ